MRLSDLSLEDLHRLLDEIILALQDTDLTPDMRDALEKERRRIERVIASKEQ
jgi:hypothetical protein